MGLFEEDKTRDMGKETMQYRFILFNLANLLKTGLLNASIGTYREDVLDVYLFNSLDEARRITYEWLEEYNSIRPHASLGNKTPNEFSSNLENVYL